MVDVMANGRRTPSTTTTFFAGLDAWEVDEKDDDDNEVADDCCQWRAPTYDAVARATTKPPDADGPSVSKRGRIMIYRSDGNSAERDNNKYNSITDID